MFITQCIPSTILGTKTIVNNTCKGPGSQTYIFQRGRKNSVLEDIQGCSEIHM